MAEPCLGNEQWDLKVDRAALSAQSLAIKKLSQLAKKFKGTFREKILLLKLAEAQQEAAKIEYRIAHGRSQGDPKSLNLSKYNQRLQSVVGTLSQLIKQYPDLDQIEGMYLNRAHAYTELNQKSKAKADLLWVSNRKTASAWTVRANLSLGELAMKENNYLQAIAFLERVEKLPNDSHYPFALYQIGWSHYNLENIPKAIDYLKRQVRYYQAKAKANDSNELSAADRALKEQSLRDMVAFYFSRYEKKDKEFTVENAFRDFADWENGPYLGTMFVHFAKLLKSRDQIPPLQSWVTNIVENHSDRPHSLDTLILYFGYLVEKEQLSYLNKSEVLFKKLKNNDIESLSSYPEAMEKLLSLGSSVQQKISGSKTQSKTSKLRSILSQIYRTYVFISEESNKKLTQVKYNLAEIEFAEGNYLAAIEGFTWIQKKNDETSPIKPYEASLKIIISLYKILEKTKLLPGRIQAQALSGEESPELSKLTSTQAKWVRSILDHFEEYGRNPKDFETFEYEAYRLLYQKGQTQAATKLMSRLIKDRPASPVAVQAANLVLDTYLMKHPEKALGFVEGLKEIPTLSSKGFKKRLGDIPAELGFRDIEKAFSTKEYFKTLTLSEAYLKEHGKNNWASDVMWLAARAAFENKDTLLSEKWLTLLIKEYPGSTNRDLALLMRAGLFEEKYSFDEAAQDYETYFKKGRSNQPEEIAHAQRLFFSSWLARKPPNLDCRHYPNGAMEACERTQALISLGGAPGKSAYEVSSERARKGFPKNRSLWAAVALKVGMDRLPSQRRLYFAKLAGEAWNEIDPLYKFSMIPIMNVTIPEAFSKTQEVLPKVAPLKSNTKALLKRINQIQEIEKTAGSIIELPWSQIKVSLLSTIGEIYSDFCQELSQLPTPKDLTPEELSQYKQSIQEVLSPFGEKRDSIRTQVRDLARKSPVEPGSIYGLNSPRRQVASTQTLEQIIIDRLTTSLAGKPPTTQSESPQNLPELWKQAVSQKNWARTGYFLREIKEKLKPKDYLLSTLRSISLFRSGARAEAIHELDSALSETPSTEKQEVNRLLLSWYEGSTIQTVPERLKSQNKLPGENQ